VAWSPDGKRIAEASAGRAGTDDAIIQIWDADNGDHVSFEVKQDDIAQSVSWSPDGKRIVTNIGGEVDVWDVDSGKKVYTCSERANPITRVSWSPDGKHIAAVGIDSRPAGSSYTTIPVLVWDANNGDLIYTHLVQDNSFGLDLSWSPDGKRIALAGMDDHTVQVWDANNGGNLYIYKGHTNGVRFVAWSPDGKRIASAGGNTVQIWDADNGGNVSTYKMTVAIMAWSPDSKRIASIGIDDQRNREHTVQVWDANNGSNLYTYKGHTEEVLDVAWSPDGKHIASGSYDYTVQVWQPPL
jgi:WD40 repeat protein